MEQERKGSPKPQAVAPARQRAATRKPYARPAIVAELKLETRAGSPLPKPLDPMNERNEYGL